MRGGAPLFMLRYRGGHPAFGGAPPPMTHTSLSALDGGRFYVPLDLYEGVLREFSALYATPLHERDGTIIDLCERLDPVEKSALFHFFVDLDLDGDAVNAARMPPLQELRETVRSAVFEALAVVATSHVVSGLKRAARSSMKRSPPGLLGMHLHFHGLLVNRRAALALHACVVAALRSRYGDPPRGSRQWSAVVDGAYSGLRMLGAQKRPALPDAPLVPDASTVYCVLDELGGDIPRYPPTYDDLRLASILALPHHIFAAKNPDPGPAAYCIFAIHDQPEYTLLDASELLALTLDPAPGAGSAEAKSLHQLDDPFAFLDGGEKEAETDPDCEREAKIRAVLAHDPCPDDLGPPTMGPLEVAAFLRVHTPFFSDGRGEFENKTRGQFAAVSQAFVSARQVPVGAQEILTDTSRSLRRAVDEGDTRAAPALSSTAAPVQGALRKLASVVLHSFSGTMPAQNEVDELLNTYTKSLVTADAETDRVVSKMRRMVAELGGMALPRACE